MFTLKALVVPLALLAFMPPYQAPATEPPAHLFSDPLYLPLRAPASVSCVKTNCPGPYHGSWAIDFLAKKGDPVHAAGYGIAHIGGTDSTCGTKVGENSHGGNWVWVDHGNGKITKYYHLNSIEITDSTQVTPETLLGTVGASGNKTTCNSAYLHYEVNLGDTRGQRLYPGTLKACDSQQNPVSYPQDLGYGSWDDLPKARLKVQSYGTNCFKIPDRNPQPLETKIEKTSNTTVNVKTLVGKPSTHVVKIWRPTTRAWDFFKIVYSQNTLAKISSLSYRRKFQIVSYSSDQYGALSASTPNVFYMADPPKAPPLRKTKTLSKNTYLIGWFTSPNNGGLSVHGYKAYIYKNSKLLKVKTFPSTTRHFKLKTVPPGTYVVKMVSVNPTGISTQPTIWTKK